MESKVSLLLEEVPNTIKFKVMRNHTSEDIMGGRNSVNPEQSSVVTENETEIEMESQLGSAFSGSVISIQEASPYVSFPTKVLYLTISSS